VKFINLDILEVQMAGFNGVLCST